MRVDALHQCVCSSDPRPNLNLSQPHLILSYPSLILSSTPTPAPIPTPTPTPTLTHIPSPIPNPNPRCDNSSPLLTREPGMPRKTAAGAFFKGTAVAVLDASLSQVLGWTWFISSPGVQAQGPPPLTLTLTLLYP